MYKSEKCSFCKHMRLNFGALVNKNLHLALAQKMILYFLGVLPSRRNSQLCPELIYRLKRCVSPVCVVFDSNLRGCDFGRIRDPEVRIWESDSVWASYRP